MKIEIPPNKNIFVLTGPESSGKTTCANRLAQAYNIHLVEEYAREYLNNNGPHYTFEDLKKIAKVQLQQEQFAHSHHSLLLCDTDLITIEIWANEKYNKSLPYADDLIDKKHYLLCVPDIPWEPDPLRENPSDRLRLFNDYEGFLKARNLPYTTLDKIARSQLQLSFNTETNALH